MSLYYACASLHMPSNCPSLSNLIFWTCRIAGLASATCMSGVGVEVTYFAQPIGWYALAVAGVLVALETLFMVNLCISIGYRPGKLLTLVLDGLEWMDSSKKFPLYILLSIPCFFQPYSAWLLLIPGILLMATGFLNLLLTLLLRRERRIREGEETNYDRFDEFAENINGGHTEFPANGRLEIPTVCVRHQLLREDYEDHEDFPSV